MIYIIQLIIIGFAMLLAISAIATKSSHKASALKKISIITLAFLMIVAVLFPELINSAANIVGVGRGADLLLYALTIAFLFYVINNYSHQQIQNDITIRIARKIALVEANEKYIDEL